MDDASGISVRPANADDLDALVRLLRQLHSDFPTDRDKAEGVLAEMLRQEGRTVLVAVSGAEVVGTADLLLVANLTHAASPWAIVENVVVDRAIRRGGIGRALMTEVLDRATQAGCYMVQLVSLKHRSAAHAFYDQIGFEPVAEGFRRYLNGFVASRPDAPEG
jgi:ribosomal protein S18 acetylase RimI-like enzyme